MSLRDNFHALCKTRGLDASGHIGDWSSDFEYDHSHIQIMWEGFQAGAASRDAEVVSLTNQRDYEYVRAENAEQERDQFEQVRDQLRAEVEILKESLRLACEIREGTSMGEQRLLYWEQLQEKLATAETELAAALAACKSKDEAIMEGLETYKIPMTARIVEALAIQPDDSALEAIVRKAGEVMRERCAAACAGPNKDWNIFADDAGHAIHALPAVTLEDLK